MTTIEQWETGKTYLFDDVEYVSCGILCLLCFIATVSEGIIVYATLNQRAYSVGTKLLLSLCIAEFLVTLIVCIYTSIELAAGGWSLGPESCIANAILILTLEAISMSSLAGIAVDRYLSIIKSYYITDYQCMIYIAVLWIGFILLFNVPPYLFRYIGRYYALEAGKLVCSVAFWDRRPGIVFTSIFILTFIAFSIGLLLFSYGSIVVKYMASMTTKRQSEMKSAEIKKEESMDLHLGKKLSEKDKGKPVVLIPNTRHPTSPSTKNNWSTRIAKSPSSKQAESPSSIIPPRLVPHELSANEIKLLTKTVSISLGFVVSWTPYFIKILYELISAGPASSAFDAICVVCVAVNSIVNCIILFLFDARIKQNLYDLFGISITKKSSVKKEAMAMDDKIVKMEDKARPLPLQLRRGSDLDTVQIKS